MNAESPRGFFPSVSRCFSRPPCRMNGSGKPQLLGPSERIVFAVPMSTSFTDLGSRPTAKNPPQTQVPRFFFWFLFVLFFWFGFTVSSPVSVVCISRVVFLLLYLKGHFDLFGGMHDSL